jgi:hypothetical protein
MKCEDYNVPDMTNLSKTCKMPECSPRNFVTTNGECEMCPEYKITGTDKISCAYPICQPR